METTRQSWQLGSAPSVASNMDKSKNPLRHLYQIIIQLAAIIIWELGLQLRSMAFWILLAAFSVLTAIFVYFQSLPTNIYISNEQIAVAAGSYEVSFVLFLVPFLFLNTFARDKQRKTETLLWARPLTSMVYATGKGLASALISLLVSWPPLLFGWLVISITHNALLSLQPWLIMQLINGAAVILITLLSLFCIELTSLPLLGALLTAAIVLYIDIMLPKSMVLFTNLTAATLFMSPSIGLGPDTSLVLWQRLTYLAVALLCLALLLLVYQIRKRTGIASLRHWVTTGLLILVISALLFTSLNTFQNTVAHAGDPGQVAAPVNLHISQYHLTVTADPSSGQIQGTATFLVSSTTPLTQTFSLGLNAGLHAQRVSLLATPAGTPQPLSFVEHDGWVGIDMNNAGLTPLHPITVSITYAGQMVLGRDYYAKAEAGIGQGVAQGTNYFYFSYLGQGMGELLGAAGSWFPLPWTQEALDTYGTRIPIDTLQMRIPASFTVFSALSQPVRTANGQWQEITASPHKSLPVALFAILQHPQSLSIAGSTLWYQGSTPDQSQIQSYTLAIQETGRLNTWLSAKNTKEALTVIRVPLLQIPFVGPGLLLLPESPATTPGVATTTLSLANANANNIAQAWWLNATLIPFAPALSEPDLQVPYNTIGPIPNSYSLTMLSAYSAAVITDRTVGQNFLQREIVVCQQFEANNQSTSLTEQQKLNQQMSQLGLDGCTNSELGLYKIQQQLGANQLTRILQMYVLQDSQSTVRLRDLLKQVSAQAGHNVIPEIASYICSGRNALVAGGNDPLACIDQNGGTGS